MTTIIMALRGVAPALALIFGGMGLMGLAEWAQAKQDAVKAWREPTLYWDKLSPDGSRKITLVSYNFPGEQRFSL